MARRDKIYRAEGTVLDPEVTLARPLLKIRTRPTLERCIYPPLRAKCVDVTDFVRGLGIRDDPTIPL